MFEDQDIPVAFLDKKGDAYTTTLIIAEGACIEHASVIKLVRTYLTDLEEFGRVDLKSVRQERGGFPIEYADLNEPQATLILTYMRNNEVVREFKKRLVKAFYTLTHQPKNLDTTGLHGTFTIQNWPGKNSEFGEFDQLDKLITTISNSTQALEKLTVQLTIANQHHKAVIIQENKPQQPTPALVAFLNAWWDCLADRNLLASDLCRIVNSQQCLALTQTATTLFNLAGKNLTSKKLGTSLRLWLQQDLNDFCILNTGTRIKGSIVWRLERT